MRQNKPSVKIVPATAADLPAISRLAGVIWRAHYPSIISTEQIDYMLGKMYALETLREEISIRKIRYEQLFVSDELIGFAAYGPAEQPDVFKLHKIYLHPAWHGRGFGSLLLEHCENEVRRRGAKKLFLTVNKQNTKAIAAYQRNGFAITESLVTNIGNGFVMDDFVMTKELR